MQGWSRRASLLIVLLILSVFVQACALLIGLDTDRTLPDEDAGTDSGPSLVDAPADVPADVPADAAADVASDSPPDAPFVPGTLGGTSVALELTAAGSTGSVTVGFTTEHAWPADGTFDVVFPTGFDVSGATFVSSTGTSGSFAISKSNQTVTLTRSGGTPTSGAVTLTIGTIKNPSTSGATGTFTFTTRAQGGAVVDTTTGVAGATITAAGLGSPSVTPASLTAGALGNVDVAFTTLNPIPANGAIEITFPAGFDVSGATFSSQTGSDGTFTKSVSNQVVKLTRSGGTITGAAVSVTLHLGSIRNPRVSGSTGTYSIRTLTSADVPIDVGTAASSAIVAGALSPATITPLSLTVGVTGNVDVALTPANPWPADGKLEIIFPAGFTLPSPTYVSNTGSSGGFSIAVMSQTVTLTRDNTGTPTSSAFTIRLGNITNGGSTITTGSFTVTTKTNGGVAIDTASPSGVTFTAGALSTTSVTPQSLVAGATGDVDIKLTTATTWPANGKLLVTFPAGFVVTGAAFGTQTGSNGTFSASGSGSVVTILRTGGGATATAPGALDFTITGIKNPPISGLTGTFSMATRSNNNNDIDTVSNTAAVTITPGALTSATAAPQSTAASASGDFTVAFTLANPWPANGLLVIDFPAGFDASGATFASQMNLDGGFNLLPAPSATQITVTRNGAGTSIAALTSVSITFHTVVNPSAMGMTGSYTLTTENASGTPIDTAAPTGTNIN